MRRFTDPQGDLWDVVIGRESWGTICALFVPVRAGAAVRQTVLPATGTEAAGQLVDEMDDNALVALLHRSTLKDPHDGA